MSEVTDYRVKKSDELDKLFEDLLKADKMFVEQRVFVGSCFDFYVKKDFITTAQHDALKRILKIVS